MSTLRDMLEAQGWQRPGLDSPLYDATGRTLIPPAFFVDMIEGDVVDLQLTAEPAVVGEHKTPVVAVEFDVFGDVARVDVYRDRTAEFWREGFEEGRRQLLAETCSAPVPAVCDIGYAAAEAQGGDDDVD